MNLLSLAIILALLSGIALGFALGSKSIPTSKNISINNGNTAENQDSKSSPNQNIASFTAKEALQIADKDALSWSNDSHVFEISLFTKKFTKEGKSNGWKFSYYSQSKNKIYEVVVKDSESRTGEEKEAVEPMQTLKGELVDSSILAKYFFDANNEDSAISSLKMGYEPGAKKFIWVIFFAKGSYAIDAEL